MNTCELKLDPEDSVWGIASSIDIYNCNPLTIRDTNQIKQFVIKLCDLIEMKRFGETQVIHFGEDERVKVFAQDFFKGPHSTINVNLRH